MFPGLLGISLVRLQLRFTFVFSERADINEISLSLTGRLVLPMGSHDGEALSFSGPARRFDTDRRFPAK